MHKAQKGRLHPLRSCKRPFFILLEEKELAVLSCLHKVQVKQQY